MIDGVIIGMEWEVSLIEWIQNAMGSLTAVIGTALGFIGGGVGLPMVLLIVLFCWKKEAGKRVAVTVTAVNTWMPMLKSVVMRPRPYMEHPDRVRGIADLGSGASLDDLTAQGYSFPSSHSGVTAALFIPLAREVKKRWMWITAAAVTFLVGVSRAMTGMHYPTDILAGWALGLAGAGLCRLLEKKVGDERVRHLILLLTALPGLFFARTEDYYTALGLLAGLIAAIRFEKKYVNFRDTRYPPAMILRVAGAFALYYGLNILLKLPFDSAFLSGATKGAFLIRAARYAVIIFVIVGVYPKVFPLYERIGKRGAARA